LPRIERRLLGVCAITAAVSISGILDARDASSRTHVPEAGGVYREGILQGTPQDFASLTTSLTKVGLVGLSSAGEVIPALAEAWQMSDDQRTLRVTLGSHLTAQAALAILESQTSSGYWKDASIIAPEGQVLEFKLEKPWASFVKELATPIFPFGAFRLETPKKPDSLVLELTPNPDALKKSYLKQVELHLFTDTSSLERALRKGNLDGVYTNKPTNLSLPDNWSVVHSQLAHEYVTFINIRNETLADSNMRQRLVKGETFDPPIEFRLVVPDTPLLAEMAAQLKTEWATRQIDLIIESYPILTLTKSILPEHKYDLVLLGIDYGPDGDLYPFWHSSQIASPGRNLAGYRNKEVDRLLDEARLDPDQAKRQERYNRVREILTSEAVMLTLPAPEVTFARSPRVKGPVPETLHEAGDRWQSIASWYVKQRRVSATAEPN
jgi:ABC-type transport system substrate-binding protein